MNTRISALGLAIALVLGSGVVRAVTFDDTEKVSYPKAWDARVLPLVEFVEGRRGLKFKHPVPVTFLDDAAFDKQVAVPAPESQQDKADLTTFVSILRALGLIAGSVDVVKELDTLHKSGIIGLYIPEKHAVFVRGTTLDPFRKATLVHELTHVLQDQYFDLQKLDDTVAITALVEGDANRIEEIYRDRLSRSEEREYDKASEQLEDRSAAADNVPEILSDFLSFPYIFGPVLLDTLTQVDGNDAVDRAFRDPPQREAQILDPIDHPIGEKLRDPEPPSLPQGAKKLEDADEFGQVSLFAVLGGRLGYDAAWNAVGGWEGDRFVPYSAGGRTCVAIDVAMANQTATDTLLTAARSWARQVGAIVATSRGLVTIRACDPGLKAVAPPKTAASAFSVLAARASIIHLVMGEGADFVAGRCVADGVITTLGPAHRSDITGDDPPPARIAVLRQLLRSTYDRCRTTGNP